MTTGAACSPTVAAVYLQAAIKINAINGPMTGILIDSGAALLFMYALVIGNQVAPIVHFNNK